MEIGASIYVDSEGRAHSSSGPERFFVGYCVGTDERNPAAVQVAFAGAHTIGTFEVKKAEPVKAVEVEKEIPRFDIGDDDGRWNEIV